MNGKLLGRATVPHDADEATVRDAVNKNDRLVKKLVGREIRKCIYVKNRLMNLNCLTCEKPSGIPIWTL